MIEPAMTDQPAKSPWIIQPTRESFQQDVVERSREVPVVIDFWAEWCQPCRMLAPLLEKLADEYQGKFVLAKVETEKLPEIASAFGVQSIPAVFAVRNGELIDTFVGLLPEHQLRAFIGRILPSAAETLLAEAKSLAETNPTEAEAKYRQVIELSPNASEAQIGLAGLLLSQNRAADARLILDELEKRGYLEPEAETLKAKLHVLQHGQQAGDIDPLRRAVEANPSDLEQKFKLGEALAGAAKYEEALQTFLELIKQDRKRFSERGRQAMVDIFHLLPADSEITSKFRRQLSMVMY
jgi:putative thioredoxin